MATIPRNSHSILLEDSAITLSSGTATKQSSSASQRDALQALLAFSALHEQVRARRANPASSTTSENSGDDFVLYEVLQLVSERALKLTGADGIGIALVQEGEIICRAATGSIAPDVGARLDPHSGLSGACFRTGEMVRCDDAEHDPRVNVEASRKLQARSMIAVPLRGRRSVIGLLEAFCTEAYGFNESDARSLNLLAELIMGAMKPEEEERLEKLSPVPIKKLAPREVTVAPPAPAIDATEPQVSTLELLDELLAQPEPEDLAKEAETLPAVVPDRKVPDAKVDLNSRTGLIVVIVITLAALTTASGLWWKFHQSLSQPLAEAATPTTRTETAVASTPQTASPVPSTQAQAPEPEPTSTLASTPPPSQQALRGLLPKVTGIRHWESEDSSTVVIDLQDQVQYEVHRLTSPERIYFDLHDTTLADGFNGKTIEVGDELLARIRVAQPFPGVSRVVLETKNVSNFSVGLEPNPYRLSIEIGRSKQKSKAELGPSGMAADHEDLAPSQPMTKEDRSLRSRVPHLKIAIDAGHGGWDLGAVGRQGVVEKDLVLDIGRRLGRLLETRLGSDVIYTREDDTYVPLEQRAEMANDAQADMFVSIHGNNSDYASARGIETYYTNVSAPANSLDIEKRENSTAVSAAPVPVLTGVALKEKTTESQRLAASVERSLYGALSAKNPGLRDRGIKEAGFVVLTNTSMPAILAEVSFVSSPKDEKNLLSETYRQQIAEALYKGIMRYAGSGLHLKLASARGAVATRNEGMQK